MNCTLCHAPATFFCEDKKRPYFRCTECDLVFAAPNSHLSDNDEKAIYDFHENSPDDLRYRQFLSQLSDPLLAALKPGLRGLDYGCGPGPTLNLMLQEQGMRVDLYDVFYFPDKSQLQSAYDFVTATEVVEHFINPRISWTELFSWLKPNGLLGVMTSLNNRATPAEFKNWKYKNDPTHISFYSKATIAWLSQRFEVDYRILNERVILFSHVQANNACR